MKGSRKKVSTSGPTRPTSGKALVASCGFPNQFVYCTSRAELTCRLTTYCNSNVPREAAKRSFLVAMATKALPESATYGGSNWSALSSYVTNGRKKLQCFRLLTI